MTNDYRRFTTLYALGCPLALERVFTLEGVYPQIEKFDKSLYGYLSKHKLDRQFRNFGFHQFNRVALAECAMERDDKGLRLATYFEFREHYEKAAARNDEWLQAASVFIDGITDDLNVKRIRGITEQLDSLSTELERHTGIIHEKRSRSIESQIQGHEMGEHTLSY